MTHNVVKLVGRNDPQRTVVHGPCSAEEAESVRDGMNARALARGKVLSEERYAVSPIPVAEIGNLQVGAGVQG